jgi:hypothetical protein
MPEIKSWVINTRMKIRATSKWLELLLEVDVVYIENHLCDRNIIWQEPTSIDIKINSVTFLKYSILELLFEIRNVGTVIQFFCFLFLLPAFSFLSILLLLLPWTSSGVFFHFY